jgi:hypothetical protein
MSKLHLMTHAEFKHFSRDGSYYFRSACKETQHNLNDRQDTTASNQKLTQTQPNITTTEGY